MAVSRKLRAIFVLTALAVSGCATVRQTDPPLTANTQLLISTAVDRAAVQLKPTLKAGSRIYLDANNIDGDKEHVVYPKYTIAAVRDQLLRLGFRIVEDRSQADAVLELRSGAQSINEKSILVGIPNITMPVPLAGPITIPELAIFKYHRLHGVCKLALVAHGRDGNLLHSTGVQYGQAQQKRWVFLFLFSSTSHDLWPGE
jgi:hypothetical protein